MGVATVVVVGGCWGALVGAVVVVVDDDDAYAVKDNNIFQRYYCKTRNIREFLKKSLQNNICDPV